jgi:four helix bundle protein
MDDHHEDHRRDLPQRSFEFSRRVVNVCEMLDTSGGIRRTMANQLLRCSTSVGANIEEGQASQSKANFISKYSIACKEARESHYWLRLLVATAIVPEPRLHDLIEEANQLIAILTSIIRKTKGKVIDKPHTGN